MSLRGYAKSYGLFLTDENIQSFSLYENLLLGFNQRMNLTAITQHEEIAVKHFLDSLLILKTIEIPVGASLIDVGTGAGFPGVPVKIIRPDISLTLLDSLNKRLDFLAELSRALLQENRIVHARAEILAHDSSYRERYGIAVSRAVAALPVLCEYCLPYVEPGGFFVALKGPGARGEVLAAEKALNILGGEVCDVHSFVLPDESVRNIILIKKISQTPAKYPRKPPQITKAPL